ncbi:GNAT family N-acetyltransferase [Neobacillus notoginsengisoli]|uniref:GNAT family N-acetyltransferase n=1 Tax=Neobacillus notoginsengisoli TaxID=1578198 RepID=A0A417YHL5_9BACI|nr:GNAT family N-acetyltransferase [Neobacillus notoginsengisoli]RHW32444.1 GNAT family N-acetyltransferase [Neobacillus notoginsengisoli]
MAIIEPKQFTFSNGGCFIVREALPEDAEKVLTYTKEILADSPHLITTPEELTQTEDQQEAWLTNIVEDANKLALVAELDEVIIGFLDFHNGNRIRNRHQGSFGMSVKREYRNNGVGKALLETMLEWASENETIEKVSLEVFSDNFGAIALYKKAGFEMEGIKRKAVKTEDGYHNLFLMAKFL